MDKISSTRMCIIDYENTLITFNVEKRIEIQFIPPVWINMIDRTKFNVFEEIYKFIYKIDRNIYFLWIRIFHIDRNDVDIRLEWIILIENVSNLTFLTFIKMFRSWYNILCTNDHGLNDHGLWKMNVKINFFILQRYIPCSAWEIILVEILFSLRDIGERIFKRGKIEIFYDYIMIIQLCVEKFFEF